MHILSLFFSFLLCLFILHILSQLTLHTEVPGYGYTSEGGTLCYVSSQVTHELVACDAS